MKIEVKKYKKVIKDKLILDDINLTLTSGYVYGFYGRNGSGKTMLFRAISTLIFPTSGDIFINGKSIINDDFDLSRIGLLLDSIGFFSYMTGIDNLNMLYTINNEKDINKMHEVLKKVGLEDAAYKKYSEYSLGMKQRLNIAQAFMENQELIILDEPTNGIDEKGINIIKNLVKEEKAKGKIILLASHNKEDLKMLCDKIYYLSDGKIINIEEVNLCQIK